MRKIILFVVCLSVVSCSFSDKKVYKNLYIANGGEFSDYPVAAIKLERGDQINIFPFEVKDYKIEDKYLIFKCIDYYGESKFYFMEKNFDEYNYESKVTGPLNIEEFREYLKKNKIKSDWN